MEGEQEFRPIVQLFEALEREGILFLIVGMGAAVIQGAATVTRDLDIWIGLPWRQYMRVINLCDELDAPAPYENAENVRETNIKIGETGK